jgi:hypothetical protein
LSFFYFTCNYPGVIFITPKMYWWSRQAHVSYFIQSWYVDGLGTHRNIYLHFAW